MSTKYIGILLYDFPMKTEENINEYKNFRKMIIGRGYYQLQESVYLINSNTKEHIETIEKEIKVSLGTNNASIRSLILTEEQFKKMKVLSGKLSLGEELIKNECHNLYELEAKVPYAYRSDIHSALTTLESILYSKKIGNMISEI